MASNQHEDRSAEVETDMLLPGFPPGSNSHGSSSVKDGSHHAGKKRPRRYRPKPFRRDGQSKHISSSATTFKLRPSMLLSGSTTSEGWGAPEGGGEDHEDDPNNLLNNEHAFPRVVEFIDMENHTSQLKSSVDVNEPLFQPSPSLVKFQDYKPYSVYEQTIYFRNNDTVPRRIKVLLPSSPYFEISGMKAPVKGKELKDSKVAAGMEVSFTIRFMPQEVKDYSCDLVVSTEREKFVVPVVALGNRALLQFPDSVNFDLVPVKTSTVKQLLVRNLGACKTDFHLSCTDPCFEVSPKEGVMEAQATTTIQLTFKPNRAATYSGDLVVDYWGGSKLFVALEGAAEVVDVGISEASVVLDSTYISLSSQKVIKIYNRSEVPVTFQWKSCPEEVDESDEKVRLFHELQQMKHTEEQRLNDQSFTIENDGTGSEQLDVRTARATLNRKYSQLERALGEDPMLFEDDTFAIRPNEGEIWPGGLVNITVIFRPTTSIDYTSMAYLDIGGQERRLPFTMRGHGIGPKAFLSYDVLDIGDVFLGSTHKYDVMIYNKGDIRCDWHLVEHDSPFASTFTISPQSGILEVGESVRLSITFSSKILGEFAETFHFELKGSNEPLVCQIKGHVLGPSFRFDQESLNFGMVSYDFLNTRTFKLINTCEIPLNYKFRVPQDGTFTKKEFEITPSSGCVSPFEEQLIQVDFTSISLKAYEYFLLVDVEDVGEGIGSLPIFAECQVPAIKVVSGDMDYGEIFMRFPYVQELVLVNTHPELSAKYEILAQEDSTTEIATYEGLPSLGAIPPNCHHPVKIQLTSDKLGSFRLPMHVSIRGSVEPPLQVNIGATSRGPRVELNQAEIKWGPTSCLKDSCRKLVMTNTSTIPAAFKTFIKNTRSVFRIDVRDGVLAPQESLEFMLTAFLDDTIVHRDTLHIIVTEGDNLVVPLSAKGTGTTVYCSESLEVVDFGPQFTNRPCDRRLTLENKGRRKQRLRWTNQTVVDALAAQAQKLKKMELEAKKLNPNKPFNPKLPEITPRFSVIPTEIELRPWTAVTYIFRGTSLKAGNIKEDFICEAMVDKETCFKPIFNTTLKASFITPLLEMSESSLHFDYTWEKDVPLAIEHKPLTLTNRSDLPLNFTLKVTPPFALDVTDHSLAPGTSVTVKVMFDPGFKFDKQSQRIEQKLIVVYVNHPQRDEIALLGEIHFPNLDFEFTQVNFGCVLNDTTKTMLVRVKNTSTVETAFNWVFIEDEEASRNANSTKKPYIPINQVFDILPIRSRLRPGETEDVEFVYYGHAGRKFRGTALCEVEGGPTYELSLLGEGSTVSYQLDRAFLDFGKVLHSRREEKEFYLLNPSKVTFSFKINLDKVVRQGVVDVSPSSGKVFGGEKQKIIVRFTPGIPEIMCERLLIEVAHFDPIEFPVYGEGVYVGVGVSLPRDLTKPVFPWREEKSEVPLKWSDVVGEAKKRLTQMDPSLLPRFFHSMDMSPPSSSGTMGASGSLSQRSARSLSTGRTGTASARTEPLRSSRFTPGPPSRQTSRSSVSSQGTNGGVNTGRNSGRGMVATGRSLGTDLRGGSHSSSRQAGLSATTTSVHDRPPSALEVEMEANRIVYIRYLEDLQKTLAYIAAQQHLTDEADGATRAEARTSSSSSSGVPKLELFRASAGPPTAVTSLKAAAAMTAGGNTKVGAKDKPPGSDFVIARHVLDFGHVVSGTIKTLKFKVTNPALAGSGTLSWSFPKTLLADTGFSITPEKVVRLPEGASADFEVVLNAKTSIPLGRKEVELPIEVPNGPITMIVLRVNICIPEVTLNVDTLDFGKVYAGWCRTKVFQIQNASPVAAEWEIKRATGGQVKFEDRFVLNPRMGLLAPDQRVNVTVDFLPLEERNYTIRLPIKVMSSSNYKSIDLTGQGQLTTVRFEPSIVELAPILPGTQEAEREVTMVNASDRAIEVYSVDFDDQYLQEEEMVRACTTFGPDGMLRVPIRQPGDPLPDSILEDYQRSIQPPDDSPMEDDGLVDSPPPVDRDPTVRDEGKAQDLLIIGPPFTGKTSLASALHRKLTYPVVCLDDAIDQCLKMRSPLGAEIRHATDKQTQKEQAALMAIVTPLKEQLASARAALEVALKAKSKAKGKAAAEPPPEAAEVERLQKDLDARAVGRGIHEALLCKILEWRLKDQQDAARGAIIDSLDNTYGITGEVAARCLRAVTPRLVTLHLEIRQEEDYTALLKRIDNEALTLMDNFTRQEEAKLGLAAAAAVSTPASSGTGPTENRPTPPPSSERVLKLSSHVSGSSVVSASSTASKGTPSTPAITAEAFAAAQAMRQLLTSVYDTNTGKLQGPKSPYVSFLADIPAVLQVLEEPADAEAKPVPPSQVEDTTTLTTSEASPVVVDEPSPAVSLVTIVVKPSQVLSETIQEGLGMCPPPLVPLPPPNDLPIPKPRTYQLLRRPIERLGRNPPKTFAIIPMDNKPQPQYRWCLPPNSSTTFKIKFSAPEVGRYDANLTFEAIGSTKQIFLPCTASAAVPTINSDPRNVFMHRTKTRAPEGLPVSKKYIMSQSTFEFGPLLLWKNGTSALAGGPTSEGYKAAYATNGECIRMTNNGHFPVVMTLAMASANTGTSGTTTAASAAPTTTGIFSVEPKELSLEVGETKEVVIWAFPSQAQAYSDTLVASLKDNPTPYNFNLSAVGVLPCVQLTGEWFQKAIQLRALAETLPDAPPEPVVEEPKKGKAPAKKGAKDASPPQPSPKQAALAKAKDIESNPIVDFDRLLLGKLEIQEFHIKNTALVPVAWRIDTSEMAQVAPEITVSPQQGVIGVAQEAVVAVTFKSTREQALSTSLSVEFSDVEGGLMSQSDRISWMKIRVQAEGYKIHFVPFSRSSINYGNLRVGDSKTEAVTLSNEGKYPYAFNFDIRKASTKDVFTIEPASGTIAPGQTVEVRLTFCSTKPLSIKDSKDIRCKISEPLTGEVVEELILQTNVRCLYSAFRLQPSRGLNFGAVKFNDPTKTRTFEIKNEGVFPVIYVVAGPQIDSEAAAALTCAMPAALRDPSTVMPPTLVMPPTGPRNLGHFRVSPGGGSLEPGQSATVEVSFTPSGCAAYKESIQVLVSGVSATDPMALAGRAYELMVESCYPGIITTDWRSIFEEQLVVQSIDEYTQGQGPGSRKALEGPFFAQDDKTLSFGAVVCSVHSKGVVERIKITNPFKINASVNFEVTDPAVAVPANAPETLKGGKEKAGNKKAAEPPAAKKELPFSVQPTTWDIPPHEHRYVNVSFNPKDMSSYTGLLTAKVTDAVDPTFKELSFKLLGTGTLPCVTILSPKDRVAGGNLPVDFGTVQVRKSKVIPLVLENNGVVPATCLFEMEPCPDLKFGPANGSLTFQPGEKHCVDIMFAPQGAGALTKTIRMSVMHNPYETTTISITGTGLSRDVSLEDLTSMPGSALKKEGIIFPELNLDEPAQAAAGTKVSFSIVNTSALPVRFKWAQHPSVTFTPSLGHLAPHTKKDIVARYLTSSPDKLNEVPISFVSQRIRHTVPSADWDDSMKTMRPGTTEEIARLKNAAPLSTLATENKPGAKSKAGASKEGASEPDKTSMSLGPLGEDGVQMVVVTNPEPAYETVEPAQDQPLLVSAVADHLRYECSTKSMNFKLTAMYQARIATINIKNTSNTQLPYSFSFSKCDATSRPATATDSLIIPNPFSIDPAQGSIAPKASETFTVRFLPLEVDSFHYRLHADIPGLPATVQSLEVELIGQSYRPACHFELNESSSSSSYLVTRSPTLRNEKGQVGPIEAATVRVVEMTSIGVQSRNVKRFLVMNPTSSAYEFVWDVQGVPSPAWRCLTTRGTILAGKKGEMVFEYTPDEIGVAETFFRFKIQGQKEDELFLFVGHVVEPQVALDRVRVELSATMVGTAVTDTFHLVNDEDTPFSFSFDRKLLMPTGVAASKYNPKTRPLLDINPVAGMIPPKGRIAITVTLCPDEEKSYNFNIPITVRRKPARLNLNLKGEGYIVHSKLTVTDTLDSSSGHEAGTLEASAMEIQPKPAVNVVDFGGVHLNEKLVKVVSLVNVGKFNFDYHIQHSLQHNMVLLHGLQRPQGALRKGERVDLRLEFTPTKEISLEGCWLKCTIAGKFDHEIRLGGVGLRPAVAFSFLQQDFGPCFVSVPGLQPVPEKTVLRLTNNDSLTTFSIDTTFQKTHVLDVLLRPTVLEPGQVLDIPILFTPRAIQDYDLTVPFVINGTSTVNVQVLGQGIQPRLELMDPTKSLVAFGQVSDGAQMTRQVQVVNRAKKSITFDLVDSLGSSLSRLEDECGLMIYPRYPVTVGPKEVTNVDISFVPKKRVLPFNEELHIRYLQQTKKLLSVSGQCVGYEVVLETDALAFGTVCLGSSRTKKLQVANNGEMLSRYRWEQRTFGPHISITPLEGVLQPFSEVAMEVKFAPVEVNEDIRVDRIQLFCEGLGPLFLNCSGSCVPLPSTSVSSVCFQSKARSMEVKSINLVNPTDKPWYLHPVLKGVHWKGPDQVMVPAKGSAEYKITFWPLVMTTKSEPEEPLKGSLFFSLPTGEALLYNLQGMAGPPDPKPVVSVTCPAKQVFLVNLPVENWLGMAQKFSVSIQPGSTSSPATSFTGVQILEVPPYTTRDYGLRFYACTEGRATATVRFTNLEDQEYVHFNVEVAVTEPDIIDVLEMQAPVRQTARSLLTIDNPLPPTTHVTFPEKWWSCDSPCIRLVPVGDMSGKTEGVFEVEYRPLVAIPDLAAPQEALLTFQCNELGRYKYKLRLTASPPSSQPTFNFEAPLGGSQVNTFIFRAYNTTPIKADCQVQKPLFFTVPPSIDVPAGGWEGQDVKVAITFEPESVDTVTDTLTISCGQYGVYKVSLKGNAKAPIPQGPIRFHSPGETKEIGYRNIFQEPVEFNYVVDSPYFLLKQPTELVPAKTPKAVLVTFQPGSTAPRGTPIIAKLLISAKSKPQLPPWIYYLQASY